MSASVPDDVQAILARYRLRIDGEAVQSYAGFSGARVWKVESSHGCWAVRRWPAQGLSATRIRGLHRLLEHLHRRGLDFVAVPVPADDGDTLTSLPGNPALWQAEPWLPGVADYEDHPSERRLRAAVAALARWHEAAATFVPANDVRPWFGIQPSAPSPAVVERLQAARKLTPERLSTLTDAIRRLPEGEPRAACLDMASLLGRILPGICAELTAMRSQAVPLQPCLRDVWHDHVLFTGDDVTGLIDPSACRQENVAADLTRLVGSLVEDDPDGWRIALEEYGRRRALSLAEHALLAVLDRSGVALSAATWLEWLSIDGRQFDHPEAMLKRLHHWRRRLVHLDRRSRQGPG